MGIEEQVDKMIEQLKQLQGMVSDISISMEMTTRAKELKNKLWKDEREARGANYNENA